MKGQEFRFHGVLGGAQVCALVHDLDGFLRARPDETICVYIHEDNGDRPQPVAKGDVTWQSVD